MKFFKDGQFDHKLVKNKKDDYSTQKKDDY